MDTEQQLREENEALRDTLQQHRFLLASLAPTCLHCGLAKGEVCPAGYPGCGMADDLSLGNADSERTLEKWRKMPPYKV